MFDIEKAIEEFDLLIGKLKDRKAPVENMMGIIGERYFSTPASYRTALHDAFPGGLLHHSLAVTRNFSEICKLWAPKTSLETIVICGLFHDLGKIGMLSGEELYTPTPPSETWKLKNGQVYTYQKDLPDGLSHAQRSIRILNHFNVSLTDDEHIAILAHDGPYKEENKQIIYLKLKLACLLHWADMWTYANSEKS